MSEVHRQHLTCPLCEVMCGLIVEHRDGQVTSIKPNRNDVLSRGHICPKAVALKDLHEDPDRIRQPLQRTAEGWHEISWEAAFDEIERRIGTIRSRYGANALALYAGNPTVHNLGALLTIGQLVRAAQTRNFYSATSVDQLPHMMAAWAMFGHQFLMPVPDIDRTQLFVCIGGNPVASGGSIMGAPGFTRRVEELHARGGRLVVVDPRRTETAEIADDHFAIRPGTDVFLLLALLHELFSSGAARLGHLTERSEGLPALREAVLKFNPTELTARTGLDHDRIVALARDISAEPRALVYGRVGACTQEFGGLTLWLIYCLNALTGHLDAEGGMMFAEPAVDLTRAYGSRGHYGRFRSRVRGLPEFSGELPVAALAEEINTPGDGQVRALLTFAGNPVLSTPNGRQLDDALASLDFMVSVDLYVNETTRHAHIILPPTSPLERPHYDIALSAFAVRNVAKFSPALFQKPSGAWHDNEILTELAERIAMPGPTNAATARLRKNIMRRIGPQRVLDWMLRTGRYGLPDKGAIGLLARLPGMSSLRNLLQGPHRRPQGLSLRALLDSPDGVDLGALEPNLLRRLATSDGRLHLAPQAYLADLTRVHDVLKLPLPALMLIGRRDVRSNNSWLHNSQRLVKGRPRCTLMINPLDAATRGIVDGDAVRLRSRVGEICVVAELTDHVREGVVSLPHGWGHDREGVRLGVARAHAGVSINDLVDDQCVDSLTGNAVLNGTPVELERAVVRAPARSAGAVPSDSAAL